MLNWYSPSQNYEFRCSAAPAVVHGLEHRHAQLHQGDRLLAREADTAFATTAERVLEQVVHTLVSVLAEVAPSSHRARVRLLAE